VCVWGVCVVSVVSCGVVLCIYIYQSNGQVFHTR